MRIPCLEDCPVDSCPYACGNPTKGHAGNHKCANGHQWLIALAADSEGEPSDGDAVSSYLLPPATGDEGAASGTVQVTFVNNLASGLSWVIIDGTTGNSVFNGYLSERNTSGDRTTVTLQTQLGSDGNAFYKAEHQSNYSHVSFLNDGKVVFMN